MKSNDPLPVKKITFCHHFGKDKRRHFETYKEIQDYDDSLIDKKYFTSIRAIERNELFQEVLSSIRKKYGIPDDGFSFEDLKKKQAFSFGKISRQNKGNALSFWMQRVGWDFKDKLSKKIKLPNLPKYTFMQMAIYNSVYLPLKRLEIHTSPFQDRISIVIKSPMSQTELIKIIRTKDVSVRLNREMEALRNYQETYISDRDFEIMQLKDEDRLKFVEIADIIAEKTGDDRLNEDSVKTAYHTAKKKIASLSASKGK